MWAVRNFMGNTTQIRPLREFWGQRKPRLSGQDDLNQVSGGILATGETECITRAPKGAHRDQKKRSKGPNLKFLAKTTQIKFLRES